MRAKFFMLIVLLLFSGLTAGCGGVSAQPATDLTLQLNWTHEAEFAGFYMAQEKGFYEDAGLNVTINPGGLGVDEYQVLLNGKADIAVLTLNEYITGVEADDATTAFGAVFQLPPPVLFSLAESGIKSPADFAGKRLAIKDEGWRQIFHDVLKNAGVPLDAVEEVDVNFDQMQLLFDGEVDVWSGYVHDEITDARLAGYDLNLIFPYEYGVGSYEGILTAKKDFVSQSPDVIERFFRATQQGWLYAVENPDETAEILAKWQPDHDVNFHRTAINALIPLVDTGEHPIGWIDEARWRQALGSVAKEDDPKYTADFLSAINQ
ncbi:MAG: hypothetical protein D6768_04180 [Chloroflexi bacterium]|nr:MAG: hypothetical protein D6768_04180 [Chloroflexota bacterium]